MSGDGTVGCVATDSAAPPGPEALVAEVDHATERLIRTASLLSDAAVRQPSALPGWTRGHVLTHLARQADSLVNLLTWARTGVETPQYASPERREADIAAGAARDTRSQVRDLVDSAARLVAATATMTPEMWATTVRWRGGAERPASGIPWARLQEVEIHHADLDAGYSTADSPPWFTERLLRDLAASFTERAGVTPMLVRPGNSDIEHRIGTAVPDVTVDGPAHVLTAWLTGRTDGTGLTVAPPGATLPTLPNWK